MTVKTLRTTDVPLAINLGTKFRVTLYPVVENNENEKDEWWSCSFSMQTKSDDKMQQAATTLLTARGDVWRMRDLNKAINTVKILFSGIDEITIKLK